MKSLHQLQQDVVTTRAVVDSFLSLVPSVPYSQCGGTGRKAYDDLSHALVSHRAAVRLFRFAGAQERLKQKAA
jgi:hypothetical protein